MQGMGHNVLEDGDDLMDVFAGQDQADHRSQGRPYTIVKDELYGRHMVASRNISAGTVIMEDTPLTYGPLTTSTDLGSMCLGCYRRLSSGRVCRRCGWPVCGDQCSDQPQHRSRECQLFSERGVRYEPGDSVSLSCISVIRALMTRDQDPTTWSLIWGLMSHNEARRSKDYWVDKHTPIIKCIRETMGLTEFSEDDIDTVLGIFLVNDFEINASLDDGEEWSSSGGNETVRGLYQIASIPNHDCRSNTVHQFSSLNDGFRMIVKAARDIKKGEEITHSYVEAQEPLLVRQELLNLGKFFHCRWQQISLDVKE